MYYSIELCNSISKPDKNNFNIPPQETSRKPVFLANEIYDIIFEGSLDQYLKKRG